MLTLRAEAEVSLNECHQVGSPGQLQLGEKEIK